MCKGCAEKDQKDRNYIYEIKTFLFAFLSEDTHPTERFVANEPHSHRYHRYGPTQTRICALVKRFGFVREPQHVAGKDVLFVGDKRKTYSGLLPPHSTF